MKSSSKPESKSLRIDVHSHSLPGSYVAAMRQAGMTDVDGFPLPSWSLDAHLEAMDRYDIAICLLSISSLRLRFADGDGARRLARIADLKAAKDLSAQDRTALESRNALRLLPGLAPRLKG